MDLNKFQKQADQMAKFIIPDPFSGFRETQAKLNQLMEPHRKIQEMTDTILAPMRAVKPSTDWTNGVTAWMGGLNSVNPMMRSLGFGNPFPPGVNFESLLGYNPFGATEYFIPSFPEEAPKKEKIVIVSDIKAIIRDIYMNNDLLYTVHPRKFEEIVAELFSYRGWQVELTGQTRDGGRDIIAISNIHGFPFRCLVECKRYGKKRPVGIEFIRSFYEVIEEEKANKGIMVTSSYYTRDAKQHQTKKGTRLDLVEHQGIVNWVSDYIINPNRI